jgi:hypothetical protein
MNYTSLHLKMVWQQSHYKLTSFFPIMILDKLLSGKPILTFLPIPAARLWGSSNREQQCHFSTGRLFGISTT